MASTVSAGSTPAASDKLPEMLRPLFWDTDFDRVSWQAHRDYVVRRVLSAGTWDNIRWLRSQIDDDELRRWIMQHEGRGLSSRQLRFWEVVLDLPHDRVNEWMDSEGRRLWEGRRGE